MRAQQYAGARGRLEAVQRARPDPGPGEVLIRVRACGVCRTDLHLIDDELPRPLRPVIPGHEVVGVVQARAADVAAPALGARVGVPWLAWTCGRCAYCAGGRENLCEQARFTGYTRDGGYAEYLVADARFVFELPAGYDDGQAAPLLCAGLIGYRAYRLAGDARRLGLYGFGAAAHLLAQLARADGRAVYAFTRPGDVAAQRLAHELGAAWAGSSDEAPPEPLEAAIVFAPVGALLPQALRQVARGAPVIAAGIHMSAIPAFPYALLWGERQLRSVANLTRADGVAFLAAAARTPLRVVVEAYPLDQAQRALDDLRAGRVHGAAVLTVA
jgi:propanol-preferring alcohol dehydrogenase